MKSGCRPMDFRVYPPPFPVLLACKYLKSRTFHVVQGGPDRANAYQMLRAYQVVSSHLFWAGWLIAVLCQHRSGDVSWGQQRRPRAVSKAQVCYPWHNICSQKRNSRISEMVSSVWWLFCSKQPVFPQVCVCVSLPESILAGGSESAPWAEL